MQANVSEAGEAGEKSLLGIDAAWYVSISAKMGCSHHLTPKTCHLVRTGLRVGLEPDFQVDAP